MRNKPFVQKNKRKSCLSQFWCSVGGKGKKKNKKQKTFPQGTKEFFKKKSIEHKGDD